MTKCLKAYLKNIFLNVILSYTTKFQVETQYEANFLLVRSETQMASVLNIPKYY